MFTQNRSKKLFTFSDQHYDQSVKKQSNLYVPYSIDQVWPYWVNQLFSSHNGASLPFNKSLISKNYYYKKGTILTHSSSNDYSFVDQRGLLCPFNQPWSIDVWFCINDKLVSFSFTSETFKFSVFISSSIFKALAPLVIMELLVLEKLKD